jgi:hypothetical protein
MDFNINIRINPFLIKFFIFRFYYFTKKRMPLNFLVFFFYKIQVMSLFFRGVNIHKNNN